MSSETLIRKQKKIIFGGQKFNLQTLVDETQRIIPLLEAEVNKPHWQ